MTNRLSGFALLLLTLSMAAFSADETATRKHEILITFDNEGASAIGGGVSAPYRNRGRYSIAASARRSADEIASAYSLVEIDHWPIRSLSVYCFVYRIPPGLDRDDVIEKLKADVRIESVQPMNEFETGTEPGIDYNDTFVKLQHGLEALGVAAAHRYSLGAGVRVAIIDSDADAEHEDLKGRLRRIKVFTTSEHTSDSAHGTAVASVIGANANNAMGIVGIAPQASLELYVSCWSEDGTDNAICDSFTLAKAFDTLLENPPDILNLSLNGPDDALITRLISKAVQDGVIIVAAGATNSNASNRFPASLEQVIGVGTSDQRLLASNTTLPGSDDLQNIYAPGNQIMVAVPDNAYDFRSGSSLAAAHVSGVIALLLANSPDLPFSAVLDILRESQSSAITDSISVNACVALNLANSALSCR